MALLPTEKTKIKTSFYTQNTLIYGSPKVGKTSFAAQIPNVLFLSTEEGYNNLEIMNVKITKWEDVYTVGKELQATKHDYKTLVVDIADWFFKHCESFVMKQHEVKHPSDLPFGKGYSLVKDEFVSVVNRINQLGFGMVFISHAKEREQTTKTAKWTYMDTSMPAQANGIICGLVDFILYFYVGSDGLRHIRTKPTKHVNAGDRTGKLPELLPLDYPQFISAFETALKPKEKEKTNE